MYFPCTKLILSTIGETCSALGSKVILYLKNLQLYKDKLSVSQQDDGENKVSGEDIS
jgi:hypothetical protein